MSTNMEFNIFAVYTKNEFIQFTNRIDYLEYKL